MRLRVTQKEVAQLCDRGLVESFIELAPQPLLYSLESSLDVTDVAASFDGHIIHVTVPANVVAEWARTDQVSIEGGAQTGVQLLIEKDFQCLHKSGEGDPDAYPHPLVS